VTRRIDRPAPTQVRQAVAELAQDSDRPPSVVVLARHLGLTNTTFFRYYPDIARDVAAARRAAIASIPHPTEPRRQDDLQAHNSELRRTIEELTAQLDLAIANIQQLSIDNDRLRQETGSSHQGHPDSRQAAGWPDRLLIEPRWRRLVDTLRWIDIIEA
jgi:hypothetical protein